jgi:hypothetical protein
MLPVSAHTAALLRLPTAAIAPLHVRCLQRVPWSEKFPDADPLALDLMDKMLQFHPGKRIDVAAALKHPWLAQLHDEATEPAAPCEAACVATREHWHVPQRARCVVAAHALAPWLSAC